MTLLLPLSLVEVEYIGNYESVCDTMEYAKEFYEKPALLKDMDSRTVTDLKVSKVADTTLQKLPGMIVMSHAEFVNGAKIEQGAFLLQLHPMGGHRKNLMRNL